MSISDRKIKYFAFFVSFGIFLYFTCQIVAGYGALQVIFLDIGQGDSILIQKGAQQILIDGGSSGKTELAKLGKYLPYFDRKIDVVIATHPDKDHIGGLVDVARNFEIGEVLATGADKDTEVYGEWKDVLSYEKINSIDVWKGAEVKFSGGDLKIIHPQAKVPAGAGDGNNSSIVSRLDFGEKSFLFAGDIESPAERDILESGENIEADILKVAHHGSKYSSSEAFLDAVSPETAVISVGAKNSYGHPAEAVLEALKARNIDVLRTDEAGDIIYKCESQNEKCKVIHPF